MKNLFAFLLAVSILLSGGSAFAGIQLSAGGDPARSEGGGDANRILTAVFNDSGSALTSGTVVIWDTGNTDPDDAGFGYWVTTTTSADSNLVAGVVLSDSIPDQGVGTIVTYGPAYARHAFSTDGATDTVGTAIGTTTVAGEYGTGTGLGVKLETTANSDSGDRVGDNKLMLIFVNPSNAE